MGLDSGSTWQVAKNSSELLQSPDFSSNAGGNQMLTSNKITNIYVGMHVIYVAVFVWEDEGKTKWMFI